MPLPRKRKGEEDDKFIERCMSSQVMKKEFPTRKQRLAVCEKKKDKSKDKG